MFYNNKYKKIYDQIVDRGLKRTALELFEKHHIIPKSMGGSNSKNNIVKLTPREHFICHALLVRMVVDIKHKRSMTYAFFRMSNSNNSFYGNCNSKLYQVMRHSLYRYYRKNNGTNYGKKHSDRTKMIISKIHKGKKLSNKHREILRKYNTGRIMSTEIKQKVSIANSRNWKIIYPSGKIEIIKNLLKFCKKNNLNAAHMCCVAKGYRKHHKNYKVESL